MKQYEAGQLSKISDTVGGQESGLVQIKVRFYAAFTDRDKSVQTHTLNISTEQFNKIANLIIGRDGGEVS